MICFFIGIHHYLFDTDCKGGGFYWLIFYDKSLLYAQTIPDKTKKTMGKETPLCIATDNGVTVNVVEAIGRRIAAMDAELRGGCPAP